MKAIQVAGAVATAVALVSVSTAAASSSAGAAKVGSAHTKLGKVAADAQGRTLHLFKKDQHGHSACSGLCTTYWPPLLTHGKPVAMTGVKRSLLGSIRRSDGTRQVTIAGRPVYRFFGDAKRGDTSGEGLTDFGAEWDAVSPAGKTVG